MNARRVSGLAAAVLGLVAWACHDAPSAWEPPPDQPVPSGARRLTFSDGDDRSPTWSSDGRSVIYVAEGFGDLARSSGVLVSIPREGGTVTTVLPLVQPEGSLASAVHVPALDAAGERVAYLQLLSAGGSVCSGEDVACDATEDLDPPPALRIGRIRTRVIGANTPAEQDPTIEFEFDGVEFDPDRPTSGQPGAWITRLHPFQRLFNEMAMLPSGPAWDPDGSRLVTSDGLRLLLWTPGDATMTAVAGTDEGTSPAWSPDGASIAYARLDRGPELQTTCQHLVFGPGGPSVICVEERTQWQPGRSMIVLIAPGGETGTELAEGSDPAWSPDGAWVYFARSDGIWRIRASGGSPERVPETEGGSEPAVSPDGTELAFTIRDESGEGDIWIVPVVP